MKKVHSMSFSQFFNQEEDTAILKLQAHLKKHHIKYKIIGTTLIILVAGGIDFATPALAASSLDAGMNNLYYKFIGLGKWIIIFKGSIDTIKAVMNHDFDGAKKHFFSYVIVFLILLGLPWIFEEAEMIFKEISQRV